MKLHMKPHNTPGVLITFCGLDGCGKTTMIKRLYELLNTGYDVILTRQPSDALRRTDIFRTFMDCEDNDRYDYRNLSLMAAGDRIQHVSQVILPALQAGKIVISDRYFYSCLANLRARGYPQDRWIYEASRLMPKPDIAFFLDVDADTAIWRVRQRESEKDKWIDRNLQYRLRREYKQIAKRNGILVDSRGEPGATFAVIKDKTLDALTKNLTAGYKA